MVTRRLATVSAIEEMLIHTVVPELMLDDEAMALLGIT